MVPLILCKEYLNMATHRISFLLLIKSWNFLVYWTPSYVTMYRSYTLLKLVRFFGPPCTTSWLLADRCCLSKSVATRPHYTGFKQLHWLPVQCWPEYKLAMIKFKSWQGQTHRTWQRNASSSLTTLGAVISVLPTSTSTSAFDLRTSTWLADKFLCRWTTNLEQTTQHSPTTWHGLGWIVYIFVRF